MFSPNVDTVLPGVVVHTCNLSTQKTETTGWQVLDQSRLPNLTLLLFFLNTFLRKQSKSL